MRLEPLIKVWKASSGPLIVNPNGNKPNALATFFFAGLYCLYQKPSISYVSWPEKFLSKTPFSYLLMILDLSSVFMGKKYNSEFYERVRISRVRITPTQTRPKFLIFPIKNKSMRAIHHGYRRSYTPSTEPLLALILGRITPPF